MNKLKLGVLLLVCLLALSTAAAVTMAEEKKENINTLDTIRGANFNDNQYVPYEIIVQFRPGVKGSEIADINSKHKTEVLSTSQHGDFKRLKIAKGKSVPEMVEIYNRNPNVKYAEPNYIAQALMVPDDPYYNPYQWHLDNAEYGGINMESAWDISTGNGVIVAVIDTGVAYENYGVYFQAPDLAGTNFVEGYDLIVDAMDNFGARYILNKVAIDRDMPFFHGAVRGFEGRATTVVPGQTACLRCVYARAPQPEAAPVIGVAPAVIGSIQATEVIKYIVGIGELLTNRLLIYDGLSLEFMEMKLKRRPDCEECQHLTGGTE